MNKARITEVDAEDFLYHLYRGSEALTEGRLDLARESLETALKMQPRDPSAQDLLGKLYFKLGVYPRAIELYQEIVRQFPDSLPPRINLALAYLKTAQLREAVAQLLPVIERDPSHTRAWGYLGLCWSRLSEFAKAREAFLRAGHEGMARRMEEALEAQYGAGASPFSHLATPAEPAERDAVEDIDTTSLEPGVVQLASDTPSAPGRWIAREPGEPVDERRSGPSTLASFCATRAFAVAGRTLEVIDGALVAHEGSAARCERDGAPSMHWIAEGYCAIAAREGFDRALIALRDEALTLLERYVLAFDGGLHLEHATIAHGLRAVSFFGRGAVAIEAEGTVRVLRVLDEGSARVAAALLVGWAPGITVSDGGSEVVLEGEGFVLVRMAGGTKAGRSAA
jgi:tetratricopeptide (TPR) repeat protein